MNLKPDRIFVLFLRYGVAIFLLMTLLVMTIGYDFKTIREPYTWDENLYKNISNNFTAEHIRYLEYNVMESKPLPFLTLQKVLNNADPFYTRGLSYILMIICIVLIYKITNNKLSFLFILIPASLDSMWLTAEIIEVTFVLLSIQYANRSGLLIGLATIFRPSAILYTILLKRPQMIYVFIVGISYALLLLYLDLFFSYLYEVMNYVSGVNVGAALLVILNAIMFVIIGLNRKMLKYVVVSALFLSVNFYPHYFLPIMTFLFIGFLLNMNDDIKEINNK